MKKGLLVLLLANMAQAGKPLWTITPLTATKFSINASEMKSVQYKVTNQSKKTHTFIMKAMQGVSQDVKHNWCKNPFTLAYQESCILKLDILGSQLPGHVTQGPVICEKESQDFQCYQPSRNNTLNINWPIISFKDNPAISFTNQLTPPVAGQNIIMEADTANIQGSDPNWINQILASSASLVYIGQNLFSQTPLYQWENSTQYPWAAVGYKFYLANSDGSAGPYLGYLDFTLHGNPNDSAGICSGVTFSSTGHDPGYSFQTYPSVNYISNETFTITGTIQAVSTSPPIITNDGWLSGMGNSYSSFVANYSFWVQDYGMDEPGRWTVDSTNNAISQTTQNINGNQGSRAYPVQQNSNGDFIAGAGDVTEATGGVWQIEMKIGSNGQGPFCETFYLAERQNLDPGPNYYMDGSGSASGGTGREIDILETRWQPTGPQINLANGKNTSWNASVYQSQQMGSWADIGGAPTSGFVTFGAYINGGNLWIYAYKPNGDLWYSTDAIPRTGLYQPSGPLVPYIGTWGSGTSTFSTEYKNFIYLSPSSLGNCNPKDYPLDFLQVVKGSKSPPCVQ